MPRPLTPIRCKNCGLLMNTPVELELEGAEKMEQDLCGRCRRGLPPIKIKPSPVYEGSLRNLRPFGNRGYDKT